VLKYICIEIYLYIFIDIYADQTNIMLTNINQTHEYTFNVALQLMFNRVFIIFLFL